MKTKNLIILTVLYILTFSSCGGDPAIRYYNLGVDAASIDDIDSAIKYWKESIKYNPKLPETHYNLGMALIEKGKYKEAEEELRIAKELKSDDCDIEYGLGKALEMQEEYPLAKRYYKKAINLKPTYVPAIVGMASVEFKQGLYRSAVKYAHTATKLAPRNLEANIILAESYFRLGEYTDSYTQSLTALRYFPRNPDLLLVCGKAAYGRRMYEDALGYFVQAKQVGKLSDELFLYLGLTYLAMDKLRKAETNLKLALYKNHKNIEALKSLSDLYVKTGKLEKALEAARKAVRFSNEEDPEAILKYGYVLFKLNKNDEAIEELEKASSMDGSPLITFYYLGLAHIKAGDKEKGLYALRTFADRWKGDPELKKKTLELIEKISKKN